MCVFFIIQINPNKCQEGYIFQASILFWHPCSTFNLVQKTFCQGSLMSTSKQLNPKSILFSKRLELSMTTSKIKVISWSSCRTWCPKKSWGKRDIYWDVVSFLVYCLWGTLSLHRCNKIFFFNFEKRFSINVVLLRWYWYLFVISCFTKTSLSFQHSPISHVKFVGWQQKLPLLNLMSLNFCAALSWNFVTQVKPHV